MKRSASRSSRFSRFARQGICTGLLLTATSAVQAQLDTHALATRYFGNDAPWYEANIPFLEIDDRAIQDTYYYRWQLYRSHMRQIGAQPGEPAVTVTEFLPDVPWARHPDTDLNDSSAFHLREGRWLRNPAIVASLIDHLYRGGGNDRHFSEWIAAATLDAVRVTGDPAPPLRNLPAMRQTCELWDDHRDFARNLYWIEPLLDATEYTISSIDASGAGFTDHPSPDQNHNGFTQGYAFRPSINSYQYANALAIANFADRAGDHSAAQSFRARAAALRQATLQQLWNPQLQHFTDVYQRSTPTVKAGDFIRGRELVGYTPWMFGLVPMQSGSTPREYESAWTHLRNPAELAGPYGLRTVEPSYARYGVQYRYDQPTGKPECQWNGPSWPFQTSQTLTGMARLLQSGGAHTVTPADYLALLRQYTAQHRLASGALDLQEDYNPDTGLPIVGLARSHHYNHSTYNDLVLTGLVGIEPRDDDTLQLTPLLPSTTDPPILYFALQSLWYHGRDLTIRYDSTGNHYHQGSGITVECNGKRILGPVPVKTGGSLQVALCPIQPARIASLPNDLAVNAFEQAPTAYQVATVVTASSALPSRSPYQAIDGRLWFYPEVPNGWQPLPDDTAPSLVLTLPAEETVHSVQLAFFDDGQGIAAPTEVEFSMQVNNQWHTMTTNREAIGNGITTLQLQMPIHGAHFRLAFHPAAGKSLRLIEVELLQVSGGGAALAAVHHSAAHQRHP